jgi:hypothetical protein
MGDEAFVHPCTSILFLVSAIDKREFNDPGQARVDIHLTSYELTSVGNSLHIFRGCDKLPLSHRVGQFAFETDLWLVPVYRTRRASTR